MIALKYFIVDVFTNKQFGGNQLAVFPEGDKIPERYMQRIAKEFNFSETTFVLPPRNGTSDFHLRIFTPNEELPMAGHPTIGSAYALLKSKIIPEDKLGIILEEGVGDIPVKFNKINNRLITIMNQPVPVFGPLFEKEIIAKILSIKPSQIREDLPVQVLSSGVPFLYVPLKDISAIKAVKLKMDLYDKYLKGFVTNSLYVFTEETELPDSSVHSRMFAPGLGIFEDPATGGASGPLGGYLVKYGLAKPGDSIKSEQGYEIGRPSLIQIKIEAKGSVISSVEVGGECVLAAEGTFYLYQ